MLVWPAEPLPQPDAGKRATEGGQAAAVAVTSISWQGGWCGKLQPWQHEFGGCAACQSRSTDTLPVLAMVVPPAAADVRHSCVSTVEKQPRPIL